MQRESASNSGYHVANTDVGQTEVQMGESTIGALSSLATATVTDRCGMATLIEANLRLARKLEDLSN
jgi:hypothetical protein